MTQQTPKVILLVEDDYLDVISVQRTLTKLNADHLLYVAHNGVEALEYLNGSERREKITPDIILLDLNMPKMNGMELLGIMRNYYSLKHIRIYVMTTSSEEYDVVATQQLGASGYIIKPLNFDNGDKSKRQGDVNALREELLSGQRDLFTLVERQFWRWLPQLAPLAWQTFKNDKKDGLILTLEG